LRTSRTFVLEGARHFRRRENGNLRLLQYAGLVHNRPDLLVRVEEVMKARLAVPLVDGDEGLAIGVEGVMLGAVLLGFSRETFENIGVLLHDFLGFVDVADFEFYGDRGHNGSPLFELRDMLSVIMSSCCCVTRVTRWSLALLTRRNTLSSGIVRLCYTIEYTDGAVGIIILGMGTLRSTTYLLSWDNHLLASQKHIAKRRKSSRMAGPIAGYNLFTLLKICQI
jgi:hypothetical protein